MGREDRNKPFHTDTRGIATGRIEARYYVLHVDSLTWRSSHLLPQSIGLSVANSTNYWTSHTCRLLHLAFVARNDSIKQLASIIILLPLPMNIIIHHRFRPHPSPSIIAAETERVSGCNVPWPSPLLAPLAPWHPGTLYRTPGLRRRNRLTQSPAAASRVDVFRGDGRHWELGFLGCLRSRKNTHREPLPRDFRANCATISGGLAMYSPWGIPTISQRMVSPGLGCVSPA